ncbi:MAG: hypothetical protein OEY34_10210 [Cyclobacteriaceae bacterium]|nr:hypothetical protein [Cyclobacteriaceae bacterium]
MVLLVSTDKGLIEYSYEGDKWIFKKLHFEGFPVGFFKHDKATGIWRVAINHKHWGPKLYKSVDYGNQWIEQPVPSFKKSLNDTKISLKSIWTISDSIGGDPNCFYVGVEPAALFYTRDNGQNYELNESLWNHPTKDKWMGGGKGSKDPFLHTIHIHPDNPGEIIIGISCAGIFKTIDFGNSWVSINRGIKTEYLPDKLSEAGQDPHTIRVFPTNPNIMWTQTHCGIYKSENGGELWYPVSKEEQKIGYGFSLAIDDENHDCAWIIPCISDDMRVPLNYQLAVFFTKNNGTNWEILKEGLPETLSFDIVLRQAFEKQGNHLVFGTNNGNLYHSKNKGKTWESVSMTLAGVRAVSIID